MIQGAFVSLGGNMLDDAILSRATIEQRLNEHWFCEVECRDTLGHPIPGEEALGADCVLTHTAEDGTAVTSFSGIVIDVALKREVWGSYGCVLRAASRSWLIDHAPRNAYFGTSSINSIAAQVGGPAGVVCSLADKSVPAEYVQFSETNWRFLLRLADDHGGWVRPGPNGTELTNQFDAAQPLIFRDHYGLLEFFVDGDLRPAKVAAAQYDSAANQSSVWPGEAKLPQMEAPGQAMAGAVQGGASSLGLLGFTSRSRSWTNDAMQMAAQSEAERAQGSAVTAGGVSRDLSLMAGGAIEVQNLGEASGTWYLTEVRHVWDRTGYLNHFRVTPWQNWRAPERPHPAVAPGVQTARVVSNVDPEQRGRLVVSLFWQEGASLLLAPMLSLHSGSGFGLTVMPEVGDEVLVGFQDADPERPVILGSLWNGVQQPPATGFHVPGETNGSEFANNNIKRIVTKSGNRIHITDTPGKESISLATPLSNTFQLSEQVAETGRPAIAMRTLGDIHLRAAGRIHRQSATHSRHVDGKLLPPVDIEFRRTYWDGSPIANLPYTITFGNGTKQSGVTDGSGLGKHSGVPRGTASVVYGANRNTPTSSAKIDIHEDFAELAQIAAKGANA